MFINKVISFNSSWNQLLQKDKAYDDICSVISRFNEDTLSDSTYSSSPYDAKKDSSEKMEIMPYNLHRCWENMSEELGWSSYRMRSETPGGINLYIRHFKDGVATKMMAADRMMSFPSWVLVETPKIVSSEFCDLSVLIAPMESVRELYENPRRAMPHFFFERALAQLEDLMPINQETPFLIIGISTEETELEVIEYSSQSSQNVIERVLEFPKEHYQAGVGILSYFGEIVKQKYPDINVKVRIEQDGNVVRMIVDSPCGTKEIIEETLEDYALVVRKKAEPESLLEDKLQIQQLTNKLQIAELEVRQTASLLQIAEKYSDNRIESLENEVNFLRKQVGDQMHHMGTSQNLMLHQSKKEEKLLVMQLEHNKRTLDELIQDSSTRSELKNALQTLQGILVKGAEEADEVKAKDALMVIRDSSTETFDDLSEALKGTMYGVSGNIVFQWLQQVATFVV
ncbi:hypothetical protein AAEU31_04550 [Pseudoalteromonas sp. SSMSWG5]|uniref:hypothetical protein n=1 Tax=Pseudoalteromonas sp. SSMSWG5 TaxID=3139396 RepID=UPI003BAA42B7